MEDKKEFEKEQQENKKKEEIFGFEYGVLLGREDKEFEFYAVNNPELPYGFFDENQDFFLGQDLETKIRSLREYVENGIDGTYAIVSFQGEEEIGSAWYCAVEADDADVGQMSYTYFKNLPEIKWSLCKKDGELVEGFLEKELLALEAGKTLFPYLSKCKDFGLLREAFSLDQLKNTEEALRLYEETDLLVYDEENGTLSHRNGEEYFEAAVAWYTGMTDTKSFIEDFGEVDKETVSVKGDLLKLDDKLETAVHEHNMYAYDQAQRTIDVKKKSLNEQLNTAAKQASSKPCSEQCLRTREQR